ncbi:NAD(P)H-dependent oxidoreductase [Tenacibaculum finnmarkense]|uniref:NAD(P)H-dependent oxidoreductase n=1 Tax=Tenacibaculum finnmarkense TaxID=2781243 RepID=UPI001E4EC448|nr:NAD(P)H-dependent oxidoreductase [Tenacibaculum finnmarkense]MCD8431227.1 NAD(P)H-dependent oxidoreductase [Tenacibaculum finnmarkense genomovar ulcerans]MCG8806697.1 NAD(P)H-dependent oxidoreductase [Tenacibaculum finnmarkense]MCG8816937.1 NAD(P)H-dependent oxidoreductase [Tenacibaculum finnmarkense]MCG8881720.1 NAD(P)H-dependent oxidoreductase [Tenacibaculum finnmarkense]
MNTIENLKWRYAVKKFDENKTLSNTQITTLKEAFNLTATSFGLQPLKMVVIQNKEIQQKLVAHSWNQPQIAQASHVLVLCIPKKYEVSEVEAYFSLVKKVRNTPDEILAPFKKMLTDTISSKTQEELTIWNKNQAYIALGNLMTVAANQQIDSCPMEGFIPKKYDEILGLDKHNLTSVLVLPVGFRAEDDYMKDLKKVRKNTAEVIIEM